MMAVVWRCPSECAAHAMLATASDFQDPWGSMKTAIDWSFGMQTKG